MTEFEYRVIWDNPHRVSRARPTQHAESCKAEWAARARAQELADRGMSNIQMERRPLASWECFGIGESLTS